MKNKYLNLRNALISATVAVFTGVLLLGVTVALGEAPTYDPPGDGVSPTFSGVTVETELTVGDELVVTGPNAKIGGDNAGMYAKSGYDLLLATEDPNNWIQLLTDVVISGDLYGGNGNTPVNIPDGITTGGNVEIAGDLMVDKIGYKGLNIDDALHLLNNLNLYGNKLWSDNIDAGGDEAIVIEDDLNITGSTTFGTVAEPGSVFVEGGDLTIRGNIINDILDLVINDNLTVKGSVSIGNSDQPKDLSISGNIGNVKDIYLGNNILFSDAGDGKAGSIQTWAGGEAIKNNNRTVAGSVFIDDPLEVKGNTTVIGDIDVTGDIKKTIGDMTVRVNGPFEATDLVKIGNDTLIANGGNLTVTGKITADSIGLVYPTYTDSWQTFNSGANWAYSTYTQSCGVGNLPISCHYLTQWTEHKTDEVWVYDQYIEDDACIFKIAHKNNVDLKFHTMCWDENG